MDLKSINFLSKTDWLLKNITKLMKMDNKYKNDKSKRIPAGADKKHKKKRQKLKHNYKRSRDRKHGKSKKKLENKQEEILENKSGIQNKLSKSSEKVNKKTDGTSGSRTGTSTVTEDKSEIEKIQNVAAKNVSRKKPIKDSEGINKFKTEKVRNKKLTEKVAKIAKTLEGKNKPNKRIMKQKDVNNSGKDLEGKSESERKKRRERKGGNFKVPIETQNLLEKIKVKKEKDKNKFGNESNSDSESKKKGMKERKRSEKKDRKKPSEIPNESAKSKDKKKKVKKHSNASKNMNEQREIKKHKAKKIKGQHIQKESKGLKSKISNKKIKVEEKQAKKVYEKGKKKSKITSKFKFKKKDEKMKHVDAILTSANEEKNEIIKGQGKLRSKRKPERKLLEHRGKKDKLLKDVEVKVNKQSSSNLFPLVSSVTPTSSSTTDSSISPVITDSSPTTMDTSTESGKSITTAAPIKENKISNYDNKRTTDVKDGPTDKQKKEHKEQIAKIGKQTEEVIKTKMDNGSKIYDVKTGKDFTSTIKSERKRDRIHPDDREIIRVKAFTQKNSKVYDMAQQPNTGTGFDYAIQKPGIISSPEIKTVKGTEQSTTTTATLVGDKTTDSERKDNSNLETMDDSSSSSSSSETESESSEESEPNKIETKDAMKDNGLTNDLEHIEDIEDNTKAIITSPDEVNTDTQSKEPQDRSYTEGLVEIRTLLEIYGMEDEKREAFDKLLDEDISMSEKDIAKNLTRAVCDLPINKELLEKVLKQMLFSGLLRKEEEEMLQKNLVPQAVNESVTIALLAQVLQRQKLKK